MSSPQSAAMGLVNRPQPAITADGGEAQLRATRYGDQVVVPLFGGLQAICDEGYYFTASNPTPGTAIAFAVSDAVSETAGYYLVIRNSEGTGDRMKRIYPDFFRLRCETAPASGTAGFYFLKLGPAANHYTSGGSALTPVNPNGDGSAASVAKVYAGALTTVADSAARLIDRGNLRSVIPVVDDEWIFKFGAIEAAGSGSLAGTVALRMVIPVPPVVIPPQWHLSLQMWFPSNATTAAEFEITAGWWER